MKKRNRIIILLAPILLLFSLITVFAVSLTPLAQLYGFESIEPQSIQRVEFIRDGESRELWFSSDPVVLGELCDFINGARCLPRVVSSTSGDALTVRIFLKSPSHGGCTEMVFLSGSVVTGIFADSEREGKQSGYRIILGGLSAGDRNALLEKCEKLL